MCICVRSKDAQKQLARTSLSRIDRLFKRAFKLGYCKERIFIEDIIALKDNKLWDKITDSNLIGTLSKDDDDG